MLDDAGADALFERLREGDPSAAKELFELVYDELHGLARNHMQGQDPDHTLQATALVNEVYLKLFRHPNWESRAHFFRLASRAMRQILVDHARGKLRQKRTPPERSDLRIDAVAADFELHSLGQLVGLDTALEALRERDPQCAELVDLCFFGGRSKVEAARILGISEGTATRWLKVAKAFLRSRLDG